MQQLKIGIDRIELDNFYVSDIDIDYLKGMAAALGNVDIAGPCGARVRTITIRDNKRFLDLVIGHNKYGERHVYYTILSLSPTNFRGHNQDNMTWSEYNSYLRHVVYYIEKKYHICLKCENMRIRSMEINCNIPLTQPYAEYDRVIRLMMSLLPNYLGCLDTGRSTRSGDDPTPTYLRKNNSMAVTIYNKTEQMRKRHTPAEPADGMQDLMRIELRLKSSEKIMSAFKSSCWRDLDDELISNYFRNYITKEMLGKYERWHKKRQNELVRLIHAMRREYPKTWHHMTMQHIRNQSEMMGIPYILDIEQVAEAYKLLPDKYRNSSRAIGALMGIQIMDDLYHCHDREKIREIFGHFSASDQPPK